MGTPPKPCTQDQAFDSIFPPLDRLQSQVVRGGVCFSRDTKSTCTLRMPPTLCLLCQSNRAVVKRPKNHHKLCKPCFLKAFEDEIHHIIVSFKLFHRGEKVAIGASGGKDSTVLASVMKTLNERHDYGLDLVLLSIDEGIKGYRDDSLETVKRNSSQYHMPLKIVGYDQLYGWTMDQVVETVGKKRNCTYCGVFRRQALDRGANMLEIRHVITGHNADDFAETVLMNLLRGDLPRLSRSTSIVTGNSSSKIKRSKPLKYAYEKEIVLYAHHKKLDYFSTECIYSPEAFRGAARSLIKSLEKVRPSAILDILRSGEDMARLTPEKAHSSCDCNDGGGIGGCGSINTNTHALEQVRSGNTNLEQQSLLPNLETEINFRSAKAADGSVQLPVRSRGPRGAAVSQLQTLSQCAKCGYMTSQKMCQACTLLENLNKNRADIAI